MPFSLAGRFKAGADSPFQFKNKQPVEELVGEDDPTMDNTFSNKFQQTASKKDLVERHRFEQKSEDSSSDDTEIFSSSGKWPSDSTQYQVHLKLDFDLSEVRKTSYDEDIEYRTSERANSNKKQVLYKFAKSPNSGHIKFLGSAFKKNDHFCSKHSKNEKDQGGYNSDMSYD